LLNKNCFDVISTVVLHTTGSQNAVNSRILVTNSGDVDAVSTTLFRRMTVIEFIQLVMAGSLSASRL